MSDNVSLKEKNNFKQKTDKIGMKYKRIVVGRQNTCEMMKNYDFAFLSEICFFFVILMLLSEPFIKYTVWDMWYSLYCQNSLLFDIWFDLILFRKRLKLVMLKVFYELQRAVTNDSDKERVILSKILNQNSPKIHKFFLYNTSLSEQTHLIWSYHLMHHLNTWS